MRVGGGITARKKKRNDNWIFVPCEKMFHFKGKRLEIKKKSPKETCIILFFIFSVFEKLFMDEGMCYRQSRIKGGFFTFRYV